MNSKSVSLSIEDLSAENEVDPDEEGVLNEKLLLKLTTDNEWAQSGTSFHPRTRADKVPHLPYGVYSFRANPMGWWLERTSSKFEFPFKVYRDGSDSIVGRVKTFWRANGGNLGILMNGLRGAGKTMTAQLLGNDLIKEEKLPVLVVRGPVPLQVIFNAVQQDMMVIFDEFEKTHKDEDQQQLLSTIDGMSRSSFNRLIVFTTNRTEINENFRDRPSRIHYKFEFARVADVIIEGLINDSLPPDLMHFKPDIFEFLSSRKICTIDIVKAVIAEVVTFRESPLEFEGMLNIAKGEPPAYTIEMLNPKSNTVVSTFAHFFRLNQGGNTSYITSLLAGNQRSLDKFRDSRGAVNIHSRGWDGGSRVTLLEKVEGEEGTWLAKLCGPRQKTIYKDFEFLGDSNLWFDNKPEGFEFPFTREIVRNDPAAKEKLEEVWDEAQCQGTVYGTGTPAIFKIRITANREVQVAPSQWRPNGQLDGWD
jgi:hypothetical protein